MSSDVPNPSQGPGVGANFSSFGASAIDHLRLRLSLLGLEGKEAGIHFVQLLLWVIAALTFALIGYLLLVVGIVFVVAKLSQLDWMWVTLGAAGIHILLLLGTALVIRARLKRPVLQATMQELQKDAQWFKNQ